MAFTTTHALNDEETSDVYNIDQSVGPGAPNGNQPVDVMLVQALFRILHFELDPGVAPRPPGVTSLAVTGKVDSSTAKCIMAWQAFLRKRGLKIRLDGYFDPFRAQDELSHIAKVEYSLARLNYTCLRRCLQQGRDNFKALPTRTDVPPALRAALASRRPVALKYARESVAA